MIEQFVGTRLAHSRPPRLSDLGLPGTNTTIMTSPTGTARSAVLNYRVPRQIARPFVFAAPKLKLTAVELP